MPEERKLVTILFADVTGSTALGESLDPEDVRALIGRYYDHVRRIIAEHGGTLEKFIGDAAMAVFGLPHAHGNDPERALAAALALRAAVAEDPLLAERFTLHIGVNTGEVVASADPTSSQALVTGDAVNTAARIYDAAAPGEILAGERTHAATEAAFLFGRRRQLKAKNKRQPVPVYPLLGPRAVRQLGRPPLVGRKQDILQLSVLWGRALEEQRPQLVSIVAPAGTGKTRLLEEFLAGLDVTDGHRVAFARCPPYGQTLAYWPLRGLLEGLLGGAVESERVASAFVVDNHGAEEAARLAELVLATLGMEAESQGERETIFNAWRLLVEALASQAPRIVVFEDLHWASDSLLDLVEHMMHPRTRAALLVVATSRPELLDRRPMWGGGRRNFSALALDPLSVAQTQELVGWLAADVDETVRGRIVERSGGNPFFAIELARGAATRIDTSALPAETLPDTVHEAVLARLDQLAPSERAVLQTAAVTGRTFTPAALRAMMGDRGSPAVDSALDTLLARDLIEPSEGGTFSFRHILFRDVAYGTLARAERARLHVAVADWLEAFAADRLDEYVELIAYHLREAVNLARQSAVPFPLPVDSARVIRFLERAGEMADRAGALVEAQARLESAIALAPPAEHLRLYEKLGDCARISGQEGVEPYREALSLWRAHRDGSSVVGARLLRKLLLRLTRWQGATGVRLSEAEMETLRDEARQLAEAADDEDERWRVRVIDLFWPFWRGSITPEDVALGRRIGPAAAAYFESRGDWEALSESLDGYGSILLMSGSPLEAVETCTQRLANPRVSQLERGDAAGMLAQARSDAGDYAGCLDFARQMLLQAARPDLPPIFLGNLAMHGACAAWLSGQWLELDRLVAVIAEAWDESGREFRVPAYYRGFLPALHVALAREDRAATDLALAALQRLTDGQSTLEAWLVEAYRRDDPQVLLTPVRNAELTARDLTRGHSGVIGTAFLSEHGVPLPVVLLAQIDRAVGASSDWATRCIAIARALVEDDNTQLANAIDAAEAHDLIPHAARMRIVLAQRTGDPAPLERARPVLERLGDRQFLRRLDEVAATLR